MQWIQVIYLVRKYHDSRDKTGHDDECASKVATHDLKGITAMFSSALEHGVSDVHWPMVRRSENSLFANFLLGLPSQLSRIYSLCNERITYQFRDNLLW